MNSQRLSTSDGPPSGGTSYGPQNGLTITHEKMENLGAQDKRQRNATTIGILSDNVLLEIFDQCRKSDDEYCRSPYNVWKWHLLVHVCQWWRQIIFSSPRRLDLHLHCTYGTPFREMLGIWPTAIPIIILFPNDIRPRDEENLIATLEHPDRVSRIELSINESQLEENAVFMQEPLPVLTHLSISPYFGYTSDLPDGFLGGSAPSLQQLDLSDVQYLALPTLLLSATNLVNLRLRDIPPTPYNSPMAMVSHVAALPKLEILDIDFTGLTSLRDIILSPLLTRSILPALCVMSLSGECKYLEDFVSRIDAPQLNSILVYYESGHINSDFDSPELSKFINRSESLKIFLSRHWSRHCKIMVDQDQDIVIFCVGNTTIKQWNHKPGISVCLGEGIEGQVSHMANILGHISPIPSDIVHCTIDHVVLYMHKSASLPEQEYQDGLDWLQLLRHLTSLQTLFVSAKIAGPISQALAYADTGMITEVLPSVKLLCLEESESESEDQHMRSVHNFLAVHQESGHPVTFVETKKEFEEIFKFYQ